jgi:hypothetical protein
MIQAPALLKDLQRLLKTLEDDLRERIGAEGPLRGCEKTCRPADSARESRYNGPIEWRGRS